jgi:hypothetical protein
VSHANAKAPGLPGPASSCDTVNTRSVPPRGVEQGAQLPGKTPDSQPRGAQNGALAAPGQIDGETGALRNPHGPAQVDVGLVVVIQAWPHLPEAIKKGILAMVRVAASH